MMSGLWATQRDDYPVSVMSGYSVSEVILSRDEILYMGIEKPDILAVLTPEGLSQVPRLPGLFALTALGSRGLTLAHWCATHLAQTMHGEPVTAPQALWNTLDPARFVWRQSRRQHFKIPHLPTDRHTP